MDPRAQRLQTWLFGIAKHLADVRKSPDKAMVITNGHIIRMSYNPRTREYGASCAGTVCNTMFWLKEDDVPESWKPNLANGGYLDVQKFLNQLERPDDELANLYEVHTVMES